MSDTIQIQLGDGLVAIIDAADEAIVSPHNWRAQRSSNGRTWYAHARGTGEYLHRLLLSAPADMLVDHRNGDGLLNTRDNLRLATISQNQFNQYRPRGASRFKGVTRHKQCNAWVAEIQAHKKRRYLGFFKSEADAARAYDAAARELHGEFARLNFPDVAQSA